MMQETKKTLSPFTKAVLILFAVALFNGLLLLLRAAFMESSSFLIQILYYFCRLLSLFVEAAGVGGAIFYLARRQTKNAWLFLLAGAGASGLTLLIAAVREAFEFADYDLAGALGAYIGTAILNFLIVLLVDVAILLFVWIIFLRGRKNEFSSLVPCNWTVMAVLMVYQLFSMVPDTFSFVTDYYPNIYLVEILSIIFDYVFLFSSTLLGYMIIRITQMYLVEECEKK
ncbi:MAG: hypothetical protein IJ009_06110 [Clostridia bacterium]|nr:hypothetical protein [Clostridia bacterium]